MQTIYIFGHKNPDTDTICSTIAYAQYKEKKGCAVRAVKLGDLNNETRFILKYFGVEEPETLKTIRTQVSDLEIDEPVCIHPEASLNAAWSMMRAHGRKALAVSEDGCRLQGIVTLSDIAGTYMNVLDEQLLQHSGTPLNNIAETLGATVLCGGPEDFRPNGRVMVAALENNRLRYYIREGDIVIAGNREDCIIESILNGANLLIATCNVVPGKKALATAKEHGCVVLSTPHDTFTTAKMIHQSVPVRHVMTREGLVSVSIDDFIDDVREKMLKTRYRSYPVVDAEGNVLGMVARYHLISRKRKNAVLLDHNEKSQTAPGIEDAEIIEIIDHHRLGDIQTSSPILMKNEPVGSTATIIAKLYLAEPELLKPATAGLLLSAILSDTLKFMSPTSTAEDREVAAELAKIADIDIDEFARKMFSAGSNLKGKSLDEIINGDLKEYQLGKYKIGMAQVYAMNSESLADIRDALAEKMAYACGKNGYALLVLLITDLNHQGSEVMFTGERSDFVQKAFSLPGDTSCAFLPGVLSRKKQVVPAIMAIGEDQF